MKVKISGYPEITISSFTAFTASDGAQVNRITAVADMSGSLNNKYFIMSSANDETVYVVWVNVNSAGSEPAIENTTKVEIGVATNATANDLATELKTELGGLADFAAGGTGANCDLTFQTNGRAQLAHDDEENVGTTETGFSFVDTTPGTNAVPVSTLFKIEGTIWKDEVRIDGSVTGTLKQMRFSRELITLIVPDWRIMEVNED